MSQCHVLRRLDLQPAELSVTNDKPFVLSRVESFGSLEDLLDRSHRKGGNTAPVQSSIDHQLLRIHLFETDIITNTMKQQLFSLGFHHHSEPRRKHFKHVG